MKNKSIEISKFESKDNWEGKKIERVNSDGNEAGFFGYPLHLVPNGTGFNFNK